MRVVQNAAPSVQAHLPNRENLRKRICREALRNMPSNPTRIEDLEEIPQRFCQTIHVRIQHPQTVISDFELELSAPLKMC